MINLLLLLNLTFAADACPTEKRDQVGPYKFYAMDYGKPVGCVFIAQPSKELKKKRTMRFFKSGQVMVVTEIDNGSGKNSQTTGSRSFFVLPPNGQQKVDNLGLAVRVQDAAGLHWNFAENGKVSLEEKCRLDTQSVTDWESEKNNGFILNKCPGSIIIDSGFQKNGVMFSKPTNNSEIRDSAGKKCTVKNSELFNYPAKDEYNPKFKTSKEYYNFLSQKCKDLDLSPLVSSGGGSRAAPNPATP